SRRCRPAAPAAGVFRGMGRAVDFRHSLGLGADRAGRRRGLLRRTGRRTAGEEPHHRRSSGGGKAQPRPHHRLLVRQAFPAGAGGSPTGLEGNLGGAGRAAARDQVQRHPAARPGGADRRRTADPRLDSHLGRRNMLNLLRLLISLVLALAAAGVGAALTVTDDAGRAVTLPGPAQRIVSLAPHITELLFAAGAGEHIVAVGSYSDHPPAARALPQVGSSSGIDVERLLASRPDLVIAWQSGNGERTIARLRTLGLTVFVSEPRRLEDIPRTLMQFGQLAGTKVVAEPAAQTFLVRQRELAERYSQRPLVAVFYQIWNQPLMTVNGEQMISQLIELCGGRNIFAKLPTLAPQVGLEAVLAADPEAI